MQQNSLYFSHVDGLTMLSITILSLQLPAWIGVSPLYSMVAVLTVVWRRDFANVLEQLRSSSIRCL
jgi:hypothetical protein